METFDAVIEEINLVLEDSTTPRTVRERLTKHIGYLQDSEDDTERKKATVSSDLEDLSSDVNIPPYVRTQLYRIIGLLEEVKLVA